MRLQRRPDRGHQPVVGVGGDELDPVRPRAVRSRKSASQPAPSSAEVTCSPRISRCPSALTPVATSACTFTTRPPSRTFSTSASAATNV